LDGVTASYELSPEHKSDGAEFDHFGIVNVMKQLDGSGRLWLDCAQWILLIAGSVTLFVASRTNSKLGSAYIF